MSKSEKVQQGTLLPLKLQFFAEDGGNGAGADGGNGDGTGTEGDKSDKGGIKTFDEILKEGTYQSEFDKKVAKALETAKSKWESEAKQKLEDAKTEAEKLAKMNAEQKAKYAEEKRIAELDAREKDITVRELQAMAKVTLTDKGLPLELSQVLNYVDADSCNKSIEAVEKAFQAAVGKAVNDKLRGGNPPKGTASGTDALRAQIAKAVKGQI